MPAPAVVIAPEPLTTQPSWSETFANAVVQLIQIHHRLAASSWAQQFSIIGYASEPVPDIEAVTLPLLLLRQIVGDGLLGTVKDIYEKCLPNSSHTRFLAHHVTRLEAALDSQLPVTGERMRDFFFAVIYGTCLFHAPNRDRRYDQQTALIRRLNEQYPQGDIMNDLKFTLDNIWFNVSEVAIVCAMDYRPHVNASCSPEFPLLDKVFSTVDPIRDKIDEILKDSPTKPSPLKCPAQTFNTKTMKRPFEFTGRIRSSKFALKGIFTMLTSQHNAWIHAGATILVIVTGWWFGITKAEWLWMILAVMAVWSAEALNTAFEFLADATNPTFHPLIGKAKDVAAGAVLIAVFGSVAIGVLIFGPHLIEVIKS